MNARVRFVFAEDSPVPVNMDETNERRLIDNMRPGSEKLQENIYTETATDARWLSNRCIIHSGVNVADA